MRRTILRTCGTRLPVPSLFVSSISFILVLTIFSLHCNAYITSHGAVPAHRQREWLQQLTTEICQVKPGCLSEHQLSQAPELMYAWSHMIPPSKTASPSSLEKMTRGSENAMAVERLLKRLIEERQAGNPQAERFELGTEDYNCVLEGWARSGLGEAAAERCEQILEAMCEHGPKPNLSSFKAVLMAWRQAGIKDPRGVVARYNSPYRTQRILEWMIRLYQDGENTKVLPDSDCFDMVLQIWSRSGHPQAPQHAERVLGMMERFYESTGLERVKPRTLSFNAVLAAWTRSNDPIAADRACDVLSFMELLDSKGDATVAPDTVSFCTVMGALAKSRDPASAAEKALHFLRHVEESYLSSNSGKRPINAKLVPDTILYNTAMGCLARSNTPGAYLRARETLERQIALYNQGCKACKPDVYGFTSVIASCAAETNKKSKPHAFEVALNTFQTLRGFEDGPNHVSYGAMLKACAKLLPASSPLRNKWTKKVFLDCVEKGLVGDMVLSRMRESASIDLYKELMQGHTRRQLPEKWTRNVVETNEYRKKKLTAVNHNRNNKSSNKSRKRAEV